MSVGLLHILSIVAFVLAGVFLLVAALLFFRFDIPTVIGDITGSNARKAIESIRQQNEQSGNKGYRPSPVNMARGKLTDQMTPSGNLKRKTKGLGGGVGTEKISTEKLVPTGSETSILMQGEETTILSQGQETTILDQSPENTIFSQSQETTLLYDNEGRNEFSVDVDMCFMGSDEVIE